MDKSKREKVNGCYFQIINTYPKMTEEEKIRAEKAAGNELYEVFLRIQKHFETNNEILKS